MTPGRTRLGLSRSVQLLIARPLILAIVLAIWIAYVRIGNIPSYVLPHPLAIAEKFIDLVMSGLLLKHAFVTLQQAVLGFLLGSLAAILLGTLISRSRFVEQALRPYIVASQTTPIIVLAPLFLLWFGFGILPKILIAAIICFFPLLVNVMVGLRSVGENELRLFRSLEASAWQRFVHLEIPHALPFIFAGLKITCILSIIGSVVGEFVGARAGLGYLSLTSAGNLETEVLFAAVLALMIIGLGFYGIITLLEKRVLFWHVSAR